MAAGTRAALVVLVLVAGPAVLTARADAGAPQAAEATAARADEATDRADGLFSLERIRRELARPETLRMSVGDDGRPVFRIEIQGQLPRFTDFLAEGERLSGPTPWGGSTHNEFLAMVTPPQARPYGAFTNGDLLQVLATSLLSGLAFQGALKGGGAIVDGVRGAIGGQQERAAAEEVRLVVEELERRREEEASRKAGDAAPPKPPPAPPQ